MCMGGLVCGCANYYGMQWMMDETRAKMFSKHKPHACRRNVPWPSNSSERETKYVFPLNLAHIRSDMSYTNKKSQTAPIQNLTQLTACGNKCHVMSIFTKQPVCNHNDCRKKLSTRANMNDIATDIHEHSTTPQNELCVTHSSLDM